MDQKKLVLMHVNAQWEGGGGGGGGHSRLSLYMSKNSTSISQYFR